MSEKRKNMKLLKPKIDVVFQSLFSKKNEKITKAFAEAILDEKVRKITINDDKELFRMMIKNYLERDQKISLEY